MRLPYYEEQADELFEKAEKLSKVAHELKNQGFQVEFVVPRFSYDLIRASLTNRYKLEEDKIIDAKVEFMGVRLRIDPNRIRRTEPNIFAINYGVFDRNWIELVVVDEPKKGKEER